MYPSTVHAVHSGGVIAAGSGSACDAIRSLEDPSAFRTPPAARVDAPGPAPQHGMVRRLTPQHTPAPLPQRAPRSIPTYGVNRSEPSDGAHVRALTSAARHPAALPAAVPTVRHTVDAVTADQRPVPFHELRCDNKPSRRHQDPDLMPLSRPSTLRTHAPSPQRAPRSTSHIGVDRREPSDRAHLRVLDGDIPSTAVAVVTSVPMTTVPYTQCNSAPSRSVHHSRFPSSELTAASPLTVPLSTMPTSTSMPSRSAHHNKLPPLKSIVASPPTAPLSRSVHRGQFPFSELTVASPQTVPPYH